MNELLTLGLIVMCIACVIVATISTVFLNIMKPGIFYISLAIRIICTASMIAAVIYNKCLAFVVCATCIIMKFIVITIFKEEELDTADVFCFSFKYFEIKLMLTFTTICTLLICIFLK